MSAWSWMMVMKRDEHTWQLKFNYVHEVRRTPMAASEKWDWAVTAGPSTIVLEITYGMNHMDHGISPWKRYINLDFCICAFPTVASTRSMGESTPHITPGRGHCLSSTSQCRSPSKYRHFLPSPTTMTVAPAAATTTVAPSPPLWPFCRRRHELPSFEYAPFDALPRRFFGSLCPSPIVFPIPFGSATWNGGGVLIAVDTLSTLDNTHFILYLRQSLLCLGGYRMTGYGPD